MMTPARECLFLNSGNSLSMRTPIVVVVTARRDDHTPLHTLAATAIYACSTIQCTRASQRSRRRSGSSICARSNLVHPIGSLGYLRCHPGSRPGLKFWLEDGILMAHGELWV